MASLCLGPRDDNDDDNDNNNNNSNNNNLIPQKRSPI